jgi:type IV secretory pathway TrbF-like protein
VICQLRFRERDRRSVHPTRDVLVIPFVVEVDKLGYAITIPTALTTSTTPATVEREALRDRRVHPGRPIREL